MMLVNLHPEHDRENPPGGFTRNDEQPEQQKVRKPVREGCLGCADAICDDCVPYERRHIYSRGGKL